MLEQNQHETYASPLCVGMNWCPSRNAYLILRDIPLEAYGYVVNGKSALEWMMERYAVTVDKASGIKNDPNDWSNDPRYIVDLIKRVVRVSLESVRIVGELPPLHEF